MVASSISKQSADVGLSNDTAKSPTTCRYKTGKCLNTRSRKRNGQPHQLCLYHRNKANLTQRKFDRQKRHVARSQKSRDLLDRKAPNLLSLRDDAVLTEVTVVPTFAASPTGSTGSTSSRTSDSSSEGFHMYSPDSPDGYLNESVWSALADANSSCVLAYSDMPLPMHWHQSYLSTDEIAFLCSAILE